MKKSVLLLLLSANIAICADSFNANPHYILPPNGTNRQFWLEQALEYKRKTIAALAISDNAGQKNLDWMRKNFTCRMVMMYDSEFFNPQTNEYKIDSLLADGRREFGGYDSIVLWHAYPRLGIDQRNQFDFYRQMPGGLAGLKSVVEKCHNQNVKVFIDYNPWDIGTNRESKSDFESLADIVSAINADGVFLDTLDAVDPNLRKALDNVRPGLALVSEGHLEFSQLRFCSGSWGQWLNTPGEPAILKLKWVEPRHIQYQIRRWDNDRSDEIADAFFNGSGMLIWENIFGTYNPWNKSDRTNWKKANLILHFFSDQFTQSFEPYRPTLQNNLFATGWSSKGKDIIVLINKGENVSIQPLLDITFQPNRLYFDLWNGEKIEPQIAGHTARIIGSIDKIGCILVIHKSMAGENLQNLLDKLKAQPEKSDSRNFSKSLVAADNVRATKKISRKKTPAGMVFVPAAAGISFEIEHIRGECGCYPDSAEMEANDVKTGFGFGLPYAAAYPYVIHQPIKHNITQKKTKPFFIDETEVTNAQFKNFLDATGYQPVVKDNFLAHWPAGKMPAELADYPVVYVDIDDARAYAKWTHKRLPTETEWQLAAQGTDSRKWPWGNDFDPNKCNTLGKLQPAKSYPDGKSPYGCLNMSGNVWEWTESCRDDGHTRFTMIRGGSYFDAQGSIWYVKGGPQPCGSHIKFVRIWQGLDRCATVGFRCVADAK